MHMTHLGGFAIPVLLAVLAVVVISHLISERDLAHRVQNVLHGRKIDGNRRPKVIIISALGNLGSLAQNLSILSKKDLAELERAARSAGFSPSPQCRSSSAASWC